MKNTDSINLNLRAGVLLMSVLVCTVATAAAQASTPVSCDEIAVMGSVNAPGRFNFKRPRLLLEVLAFAGGPTERAGKSVRVHHFCKCSPCSEGEATKTQSGTEYNLAAVLRGQEAADVYLQPGDLVIVPETNVVLVTGNVPVQRSLTFHEGMKLTGAVALAGGTIRSSDLVQVRIHREVMPGKWSVVFVGNLNRILEGKIENLTLQPMDLLEVSDEHGTYDGPLKLSPPKFDVPLFPRKSPDC